MTNEQIMKTALLQSSYDCNCLPEDFLKTENVFTVFRKNGKARAYLPDVIDCDLVTYGSNVVAQTSEELHNAVKKYVGSCSAAHCFDFPNVNLLNDELQKYGYKVCFMAEYFLPDVTKLRAFDCAYELKFLTPDGFSKLYLPEFSNALCEKRKNLDVIALGAYDGEKLVGLSGASADCEDMWQIGVDVLPEYRKRGVASALTSSLALKILSLNKVPFYCSAWCNVKSVRNALKCGFYTAWTELSARKTEYVDELIGKLTETN